MVARKRQRGQLDALGPRNQRCCSERFFDRTLTAKSRDAHRTQRSLSDAGGGVQFVAAGDGLLELEQEQLIATDMMRTWPASSDRELESEHSEARYEGLEVGAGESPALLPWRPIQPVEWGDYLCSFGRLPERLPRHFLYLPGGD